MANRVSNKRLAYLMECITNLQMRPIQPMQATDHGTIFNIGGLILEYAKEYGGYQLMEIINDHGAQGPVSGNLRLSAREMELFMMGMIQALEGSHACPSPKAKLREMRLLLEDVLEKLPDELFGKALDDVCADVAKVVNALDELTAHR